MYTQLSAYSSLPSQSSLVSVLLKPLVICTGLQSLFHSGLEFSYSTSGLLAVRSFAFSAIAINTMFSKFVLALIGASTTFAMPLTKRAVDNTQPAGHNPVSLAFNAEYLGPQKSENSCVNRDLGFTGQIAGKWYAVWGDTSYCAPGVRDSTSPEAMAGGFHGMVRDSISAMTISVLETQDLNLNSDTPISYPKQFVPYNSAWGEDGHTGFGGTSLCETNATTGEGLVFYAVVSYTLISSDCAKNFFPQSIILRSSSRTES